MTSRNPPWTTKPQPRVTMSMEAALEEERREVEALVAARNAALARPASALSGGRSSSPYTPRSPVRSMLDIGEKSPLPSPRLSQLWPSSVPCLGVNKVFANVQQALRDRQRKHLFGVCWIWTALQHLVPRKQEANRSLARLRPRSCSPISSPMLPTLRTPDTCLMSRRGP